MVALGAEVRRRVAAAEAAVRRRALRAVGATEGPVPPRQHRSQVGDDDLDDDAEVAAVAREARFSLPPPLIVHNPNSVADPAAPVGSASTPHHRPALAPGFYRPPDGSGAEPGGPHWLRLRVLRAAPAQRALRDACERAWRTVYEGVLMSRKTPKFTAIG